MLFTVVFHLKQVLEILVGMQIEHGLSAQNLKPLLDPFWKKKRACLGVHPIN